MKAIITRLRRLETKLFPEADDESQRLADLLWERRRRRLAASGQPAEERPRPTSPGRRMTIGETLRLRFVRPMNDRPAL